MRNRTDTHHVFTYPTAPGALPYAPARSVTHPLNQRLGRKFKLAPPAISAQRLSRLQLSRFANQGLACELYERPTFLEGEC